ncbi:unnamed protein product [Mucor hiemalis]
MAENFAKANQYQYAATSSLVLQANRKGLPRRDQEPTGEPDSLWGKIDPKDFGSRAEKEAPKDIEEKKKKAAAKRSEILMKRDVERRKKTPLVKHMVIHLFSLQLRIGKDSIIDHVQKKHAKLMNTFYLLFMNI